MKLLLEFNSLRAKASNHPNIDDYNDDDDDLATGPERLYITQTRRNIDSYYTWI